MRPYKKAGTPRPPADAHHWMCWKFSEVTTPGMDLRRVKKLKMTMPPLEDGSIPDSWPISEFSTKRLLACWGDGKYQVEWYEESGKRIRMTVYEVAEPRPEAGPKLRARKPMPAIDDDDDAPPLERLRRSGGQSMSLMDYLMLQRQDQAAAQEREERLSQRHREEAAAAQQRDREFMGAIIATLKQPAQTGAPDADLLRREMALAIREGLHTIRKDVSEQLAQIPSGDDEEEEDDKPPKDLEEATERIGQQLLATIETRAPHLVEELVPRVTDWLKARIPKTSGRRADGN